MDVCMFCGTSDRGPYLSVVDSHFLRLEILLESHLRGNYLASASPRFSTLCHVLFIFSAFRSACNCNFSSRFYEERLIVVSVEPGSFWGGESSAGSGKAGHLEQWESSPHFISPDKLILLPECFEPKMNENTETCVLNALGPTNAAAFWHFFKMLDEACSSSDKSSSGWEYF